MSAKERFVAGMWLLLFCISVAVIGGALWSHVDSHDRITRPVARVCLLGAPCPALSKSYVMTTPNRVPSVFAFVLGGLAGSLGLLLIRSHPTIPATHHHQPEST